MGERLRRAEETLSADGSARGGLLGRRAVPFSDRRQLEEERDALRSEYRALTSRLGREAPQPSVKEADDVLGAARNLDERAALLTTGLATLAAYGFAKYRFVMRKPLMVLMISAQPPGR